MKEIELFINDDGEWVERISLVDEPAIDVDFLYFKKDNETNYRFSNDEKRIITGAVMIPDKRILRYENNVPFFVYFSRDTIETISQRWLMENKNHDFNLNHSTEANGIGIVESWIKVDENDKSTFLGFQDCPVGTWFVSAKITNDDVWDEIKQGKFNGFSIEGMFVFNDDETDDELFSRIAEIISQIDE